MNINNMELSRLKFVIFTPRLDYKVGGIIVLHNLAKELLEQGRAAMLYVISGEKYQNEFCNNFATMDDIDNDTIVVYPEIVEGNPLKAKNVVRWMLCDVGINCNGDIYKSWGANDLLFHFSTFNTKYDPHNVELLYTIWVDPAVKNKNLPRSGSCYLFKKASLFHKKIKMIHPKDAILIDNCSNEEIIEIFNQKEFFYCYDPYSFYDSLAALCGCIPIIYPMEGVKKIDWLKTKAIFQKYLENHDNMSGIAYGTQDIQFARETLNNAWKEKEEVVEFGKATIVNFINKTERYYLRNNDNEKLVTVGSFFNTNKKGFVNNVIINNYKTFMDGIRQFYEVKIKKYIPRAIFTKILNPILDKNSCKEEIVDSNPDNQKQKFPESKLAHKYLDGLSGLEIGGSAHNSFGLNTKNVDYSAALNTIFKKEEIDLCGESMPIDIVAPGDKIPVPDESEDFIISSHVLEHFPDPIKALKEWYRIIKPGGYIYAVVPHKERTFDKNNERTTLQELIERHENGFCPEIDTHAHYSVWVTQDVVNLIKYLNWNIVDVQDVDDKVGNGFAIVIKKQ